MRLRTFGGRRGVVHSPPMTPPDPDTPTPRARRNRSFEATHQILIEAAVRLISEKGMEALTVAALARAVNLNRATVYYHFASREALLEAVGAWSSEQLSRGFDSPESQKDRIEFVARFVLDNPDLIKLWIEQFIAPGNIRDRYPKWDELVGSSAARPGSAEMDVEVYCAFLLAGAIIGPRVFRNSIRPDASDAEVAARFRAEQQRMLRRDGLLRE